MIFEIVRHYDRTTLWVLGLLFVLVYVYLRRHIQFVTTDHVFLSLFRSFTFLLFLWKYPLHKALEETRRKYGDVFSVRLGTKQIVLLHGYDAINQVIVKNAIRFSDRTNGLPQLQHGLKNGKGVTWSNGDEWKCLRKFTTKLLHRSHDNTDNIEGKILAEVKEVEEVLKRSTKAELENGGRNLWRNTCANILRNVIFGQKAQNGDTFVTQLLHKIDVIMKGSSLATVSILNFVPKFMQPLFPSVYKELQESNKAVDDALLLLYNYIKSQKQIFDCKNDTINILDSHIESSTVVGDTSDSYLHKGNVLRLLLDVFMAGSENTANSITWTFLYMVKYPDVQTKCRQYILDLVGKRHVTLADRPKLAYVEATLQEIQRLRPVLPLGVPRTCTDPEIAINGNIILRGAVVVPNIYSSNTDNNYWNKPYEFNPGRFLDSENNLIRHKSFIPYSVGPRHCVGKLLATQETFLLFANIIAKFEFTSGTLPVDIDCSPRADRLMTLESKPYTLKHKLVSIGICAKNFNAM